METWVLFPSVSSLCSTEHLFAFGVRTGSPLHLVGHWDCHLCENPFYCSSLSNALSKICHFYLRWWWGGSEWGRRDLDCRWYLSYLRLSVHWILLNIASAISTPHIKVSEKKKWGLQCQSGWHVAWHTSCWWSNWGRFRALWGPGWNFLPGVQLEWGMYLPSYTISSSISGLTLWHWSLVFDEAIGQYQAFEFQDILLSVKFKIQEDNPLHCR